MGNMHTDLKNRDSITTIYPREIFEVEAAKNSRVGETTRHGLLIEGAPEGDGSLRVGRVTRSIGDPSGGPETLFICPYMGRAYGFFGLQGGGKGAVVENRDIFDPHPEEYHAFINTVLAAAKSFRPPPPLDRSRLPRG
jgi:hypothetical protein